MIKYFIGAALVATLAITSVAFATHPARIVQREFIYVPAQVRVERIEVPVVEYQYVPVETIVVEKQVQPVKVVREEVRVVEKQVVQKQVVHERQRLLNTRGRVRVRGGY